LSVVNEIKTSYKVKYMDETIFRPNRDQTVIVTGCGYKQLGYVFRDINNRKETHLPIFINGVEYKLNIGAATALYLAKIGYKVIMISRNEKRLALLQTALVENFGVDIRYVDFCALDMSNREEVARFLNSLGGIHRLQWVNSVGLGAGDISVVNDNPYLKVENISTDLLKGELGVMQSTAVFVQEFLSVLRAKENYISITTKIVIVTSMSAIRSCMGASAHAAGKGALDRFANALRLELWKENTHISIVRPGGVDTGLYDHPEVQKSAFEMDVEYGNFWNNQGRIIFANPISVAKAIATIFENDDFITSINMVSSGQWPNEGS
jgi:short-subunit dehydrogenase